MTEKDAIRLTQSVADIVKYCRSHVCTDCPLNIGKRNDSILNAKCVCDYNVLHLPSTWKLETLNEQTRSMIDGD